MEEDNIDALLEIVPEPKKLVLKGNDQKSFTRYLFIIMVVYNSLSIIPFYLVMGSSSGGRGMAIGLFVFPFVILSLIILGIFLFIKRKYLVFSDHWLLILLTTPILLVTALFLFIVN